MPSSLGSMPTKRRRIVYLIAIAVLFLFGLPSRLVPQYLPDFYVNYVGDGLWAMAIFFMLGLVFRSATTRRLVIVSLAITYAIEFSQLYQADWINQLRHIKLIGLILGFTFCGVTSLCTPSASLSARCWNISFCGGSRLIHHQAKNQ